MGVTIPVFVVQLVASFAMYGALRILLPNRFSLGWLGGAACIFVLSYIEQVLK